MGKASQTKGRRGEIELAAVLRDCGFSSVAAAASRSYGKEPDITGLPGIHIECKRCEILRFPAWMEQSVRDSERFHDGKPALFHRRNRGGWLVTMRLSDWLDLYRANGNDFLPADLREKIDRLQNKNPAFNSVDFLEAVRLLITLGLESLGMEE